MVILGFPGCLKAPLALWPPALVNLKCLEKIQGGLSMFNYLKMRRDEIRVKAMVYGAIVDIMENQKELLSFFQKLYAALKDVPPDELQRQFVERLAQIIHEENKEIS